jgi:hypothetical protein
MLHVRLDGHGTELKRTVQVVRQARQRTQRRATPMKTFWVTYFSGYLAGVAITNILYVALYFILK